MPDSEITELVKRHTGPDGALSVDAAAFAAFMDYLDTAPGVDIPNVDVLPAVQSMLESPPPV